MNVNKSLMEKLRWSLKSIEHKLTQYRQTTGETVTADTEYGKVKGAKRMTLYSEPYYSFEGIPYAQPPLGELRFVAPQRPTPWEGVRDCTAPKDKPVQVNFIYNKVEGSEDCLYLNVYTNNLSPDAARPVMVWIHGGGFKIGEANRDWYGPDYFMKKDVILITVQYRLGVLGFLRLDTPTLHVPGNAGLKDQVMALKWIKNNCASFGGNPDCITVFGESAGGISTHYMMLTEQTQSLFHRAILMSGTALLLAHDGEDIVKRSYTIAKMTGYKGENNEKDVLQYLVNCKAKDLIRVEDRVLTPEEHKQQIMFPFAPTIEPYSTPDCVIPKHPREMQKTAWGNSIPIMVGCTSFEGLLWMPAMKQEPHLVNDLETCENFVPPELIASGATSDEIKEMGLKIKKAHVTGEKPTAENYMDLCSSLFFWFPLHRVILNRFAYAAGAPMFMYRFDFDSEDLINPYRIMRLGRGVKGVSHADELTYLFTNILSHRMPKESREYRTIERMVGLWTRFATTGNPNDESIDGMDASTWEPLKKADTTHKCLNIGDELKLIDLPEMEKIKLWESVFDTKKSMLYQ